MDNTDQPNSICHVQPIQMYHLTAAESEKPLPFGLLAGEVQVHHGNSVDGLIVITNYRLFLQIGWNQYHIPLGLIEVVENRELFYIQIGCKDARTYRCTFENNESCLEWYDRILKAAEPPRQLEQLFAFYYFMWTKEAAGPEVMARIERQRQYSFDKTMFDNERSRMDFGFSWRISQVNINYKLCPTYPPYLLVPSCISDEVLESVAKFRSSRRIPAVVWRHSRNGAVIARCSQPEVGWLGWRSAEDEDLIKAISDACNFEIDDTNKDIEDTSNSPESLHSDSDTLQITNNVRTLNKKVLIMDARSYTTAVANRARGGGCECPEYYPNCDIQFMNLANIHSIRKSFHALRQLCTSSNEQHNWFSLLEGTKWLLHMSGLMKAAVTLVTAVERDARPVLVHCSDGWDRTPQIVALAELLLDPFYRTFDGFRTLIEREWLAFGHKFADRCGHSTGSDDQNERCPVFLQWLDCVHQLMLQFPCAFEFSLTYLVKLAQHTYSNLFGTFLCNTQQERANIIFGKTFSVWEFLNSPSFKNHLYAPHPGNVCYKRILWPLCYVRDLKVWSAVYLGSMEANSSQESGSGSCPGPPETSSHHMTKTRSYGDLLNAGDHPSIYRRNSDPSLNNVESKLANISQEKPPPSPSSKTNGTIKKTNGVLPLEKHTAVDDFVENGSSSDGLEECNNTDCMFKSRSCNNGILTDDQIDGLSRVDFETSSEICKCPVENENMVLKLNNHESENQSECCCQTNTDDKIVIREKTDKILDCPSANDVLSADNVCRTNLSIMNESDLLGCRNGAKLDDPDSERSSLTESKSESTVCDAMHGLSVSGHDKFINSVDTSTETLVSENIVPGSSPKEINGFEKIQSPTECPESNMCLQNTKFAQKSGETSQYSTPKFISRTSSSNGWDGLGQHFTPSHHKYSTPYQFSLTLDGLVPLKSPIQERLDQIFEDQRRKEDLLQKELHTYRQARIKLVCHKCNAMESERQDDNSDTELESCSSNSSRTKSSSYSNSKSSPSSSKSSSYSSVVLARRRSSVVESVGSVGEGQASGVESLRSDLSWEAVDDGSILEAGSHGQTLWVPDHAVSSCTACKIEFWMGRRKHHCRKCGKIFCADCSVHSTPLPAEHLYNPVRVCTLCFSKLHRHDDPNKVLYEDKCKLHAQPTTNSNPQITASSN